MIDPLGACVWTVALVAALVASGGVVAWAVERWSGREETMGLAGALGSRRPERWLTLFALGAGLWMLALFALGALGLLSTTPILSVALSLSAAGLALEGRRRRALSEAGPTPFETPSERAGARWQTAVIALVATAVVLTIVAVAARALIPDVSWDADVYHLTVPRLYLEHGGFFRIPFNVYSNWPLGVELLYTAALALRDHVVAKLLHLSFGVATAVLAWRLAGPGARRGVVAAALFLANPVVLAEMTVAYVDLASAFFLLLGFSGLHAALSAPVSQRPAASTRGGLLVAGIAAGALCAIKVTGFLSAGALAILFVVGALRTRWPARAFARGLALLGVPVAVMLLPWLIKSWVLTGNPVYPFLHSVLGGPEWSASLSDELSRWQRAIGMGRGPLDYLLLPARVALEGGEGYARFDGRIAPAWIALVPLAIWGGWRDALTRRALLLAGISFVLWAVSSQQMRFLVPVLGLLAVAAARALDALAQRIASARGIRNAPAAGNALALSPALLAGGLLAWFAWPWAAVAVDNAPALTRHYQELRGAVVEPTHRFVSEQLPEGARVLLLDHNRAFRLERDFVADSFLEASQIADLFRDDDPRAAARRLRELGFTHVLVERRQPGAAYPAGLRAVVAAASPLYRSPDGRILVGRLELEPFLAP